VTEYSMNFPLKKNLKVQISECAFNEIVRKRIMRARTHAHTHTHTHTHKYIHFFNVGFR
jgi:hypothetical protein